MERIPIVDENDSIIEYKERESVLPSDIYRATVMPTSSPIFLQRRIPPSLSLSLKALLPNKWVRA
jgi:hypothetical protein